MKRADTCATGLHTLCDNTGADASAAAASPRDKNTTDFLAITAYIRTTNLDKRDVVTLMDNLDKAINIAGDRKAQIAEVKAEFSTTVTEMDDTNSLLINLLIESLEQDNTVLDMLWIKIRHLNDIKQKLSTQEKAKKTPLLQSVLIKKMIAELDHQIAALKGHLTHIATRK